MKKPVWKIICITACMLFLVLTTLLIASLTTLIAGARPSGGMGIIGGADIPTFELLLHTLIESPAFYVWLAVLSVAIFSAIGWIKATKQ
jgi:hypothetical protein